MTTPKHSPADAARRQLLRQLGTAAISKAALPLAGSLAVMRDAAAATATDYKALVCVFLQGGNDTFNTVLATDSTSWTNYMAVRSGIALKPVSTARVTSASAGSPEGLGGVLAINPQTPVVGRSFALHPRLTDLQTLFNTNRRLAVVANVGPLVKPLTKDQFKTATANQIPRKLYSHNDQQNSWQSLAAEGATVGWGGRLVDQFALNPYAAMSPAGNAVWLSGNRVRQYQLTTSGVVILDALKTTNAALFGSVGVSNALRKIIANKTASHAMVADLGSIGDRSLSAAGTLITALDTVKADDARVKFDSVLRAYTNISGTATSNPLAEQLQIVARSIAVQSALGANRQVFFVSLGGFDTHDNQNQLHAELMNKLNHALAYFDASLTALGVNNKVTTFTASDFGRTFTSNGDGTDHGWGAHHLVMGGAVKGGNIYGQFPTFGVKAEKSNQFDSPDQLQNGALLPSASVEQYGATMGKWFGLSNAELASIFPNLANFNSSPLGTDLGFL